MLPSSSPCELLADSAFIDRLVVKFVEPAEESDWLIGCGCFGELVEGGVAVAPPFFLLRTAWLSFFSFCSNLNAAFTRKVV